MNKIRIVSVLLTTLLMSLTAYRITQLHLWPKPVRNYLINLDL